MNISLKFNPQTLAAAALLLAATQLSAQNIKETVTDEKYANTTIVYKKGNANDAEILSQLNGSYGMSDVVRISVAPPKPAAIPVAKIEKPTATATVHSVKPNAVAAPKMPPTQPVAAAPAKPVASAATAKVAATAAKPAAAKPRPAKPQAVPMIEFTASAPPASTLTASTDVMADLADQRKAPVAAKSAATNNFEQTLGANTKSDEQQQATAAAPKQTRSVSGSTAKSGKKSSKSGGWFDGTSARKKSTPAKKHRKRGGQKYGCFKF